MTEITRMEKFLRACIDGVPCALTPLTRVEKLLSELNETLAGQAPVVILPETEFKFETERQPDYIKEPLSAMPTEGATVKVNYNGTDYFCQVARLEDNGIVAYGIGNFAASGMPIPGSNDKAPFLIALYENDDTFGYYGMVAPLDDVLTATVSIVQVGAASGGGSNGGGTCCITLEIEMAGVNDLTYTSKDKTYAAIKAACDAGALPYCKVNLNQDGTLAAVSIAHCMVIPHNESTGFVFRIVYGIGQGFTFGIQPDDTVLVILD